MSGRFNLESTTCRGKLLKVERLSVADRCRFFLPSAHVPGTPRQEPQVCLRFRFVPPKMRLEGPVVFLPGYVETAGAGRGAKSLPDLNLADRSVPAVVRGAGSVGVSSFGISEKVG